MAKGNKNIKADRFKNVASKRVQKVLDSIDSLAKCANKNNYDYTNEEVNKMLRAIKEKVKNLEHCYSSNTNSTKEIFEF
jgi:light-regulated signal transduction histidine kinase (bacteriophytochrome)